VKGQLLVSLKSGEQSLFSNPQNVSATKGMPSEPSSILFVHHGLHLDLLIDKRTPIGANDPAGVSDLVIEAALSTILDLEDSVAAVDAQDKVLAYRELAGHC
jgi:malate synthase